MAATLQTFGGGTTDFILDPGNDAKPLPNTPYTIIDAATMLPAGGLQDASGSAVTQLTSDGVGRFAGSALLEGAEFYLQANGSDGAVYTFGPMVSTTAVADTLGLAPQLNSIASSAAASAFSAKQAQSAAEAAAAGATAPAATAIATYFGGDAKVMLGGKVAKGELAFNVRDFGAKGDNVADDTAAVTSAVAAAKANGGGVVLFPSGDYYVAGSVQLFDNIMIRGGSAFGRDGVVIRKKNTAADNYIMFYGFSERGKGYGAGPCNLAIEGVTFKGNHGVKACTSAFHHTDGLTVRDCAFEDVQGGAHAFDLAGCRRVLFERCEFRGFNPSSTTKFKESIQVDNSGLQGASIPEPDTTRYDGLPCFDVTVKNCRFIRSAASGQAPNPLGSHSGYAGVWHEKIRFEDNYVELTVADTSDALKGAVHFMTARDVDVNRNEFVHLTGAGSRAVSFRVMETGPATTDAGLATPPWPTVTTMAPTNIRVKENTFRDFDATSGQIIYVNGASTAGTPIAADVTVSSNRFYNCYPAGGTGTTGADMCDLLSVDGATFEDNSMDIGKRLLYTDTSKNVNVARNKFRQAKSYALRADKMTALSIRDNKFDGYDTAAYVSASESVNIIGNQLRGEITGGADAHIELSGCTRFTVGYNDIKGSSVKTKAVWVTGTSTIGQVKDNIITGATSPVTVDAGSTATVTGTVSS